MSAVPDEIMELARSLRGSVLWESNSSIEQIARFLLAAEMRGEKRERERCAKIVDEMGGGLMDRTPAEVAAAIRSGT